MKTKEMNVIDIVLEFLEQNNYNGLLNSDYECGCLKDDLVPCGEITGNCVAGYKVMCTSECDHEGYDPDDPNCWHIQREKPEG